MGPHCSCRRSFYFLEGRVAGFALGLANFLGRLDFVSLFCIPTHTVFPTGYLFGRRCLHRLLAYLTRGKGFDSLPTRMCTCMLRGSSRYDQMNKLRTVDVVGYNITHLEQH